MSETTNNEEAKKEEVDNIESSSKKIDKKEKSKKEPEEKTIGREIFEWIVCIVVAFVLAVFIKYFLFTPTLVQMSSMYPTIFNDERVLVNRLVRTFNIEVYRGDIITFEAPNDDENTIRNVLNGNIKAEYTEREGFEWFTYNVLEMGKISYIKRVIGVSGDHIVIDGGNVYVNDVLLDESSYLPDGTETYINGNGIKNDFVVPEGYVFCMGDNRTGSKDCRNFGCIPIEKIEGRVVGRIWPLNKFGKVTKSTISKDEVEKYNSDRMKFSI